MIHFTVPGTPVAFARAGSRADGVRFTPSKQRNFMADVKQFAADAMDGAGPLEGPISLSVRACYLRPKNKRGKGHWRTSTPDADNIAKIVSDAMNSIVFVDDRQVVELTVRKIYSDRAEVVVCVQELKEEQ